MKQAFIFFLYCISFLFASAQVNEKMILAGGQLYAATTTYDFPVKQSNPRVRNLSYNCSLGKAFKENTVLGINIGYSSVNRTNFYNGANIVTSKFKQQTIGIFGRYYTKLAPAWYLFGQCDANYVYNKQDYKDTVTAQVLSYHTVKGGEIALMPGVSFQLNHWLQLELLLPQIVSLQYQTEKYVDLTFGEAKRKRFVFNSIVQSSFPGNFGAGFQVTF